MILIIGGAFQGKLSFAMQLAGCGAESVFTPEGTAMPGDMKAYRIFNSFHLFLKQCTMERTDEETDLLLETLLQRIGRENPEMIVICDEVGCGIVPLDREDRRWRELTGRWMTRFAKESEEVYRVLSGIPVKIR